MTASSTNPIYKVNVIKADGTTYQLQNVTTDLAISQPKNELAQKLTISVVNVKVGDSRLQSLIALKDNVYAYANTGDGYKEVFRGFVWERSLQTKADRNEFQLICYDRLIYLHKSKDDYFAKNGKTTKDAITAIAKNWGFSISYKYQSITHGKLVFQQERIADIFIDILDEVKKKTGKDYVLQMDKNTIVVANVGVNSTIYKIEKKNNAIATAYRQTMEDMITKVKIVKAETVAKGDNEEESGKYLTVTSVSKNTSTYGTLQDIIVKSKEDKLSDLKEEANQILKDHATPTTEIEVSAIDNPWIKKGDKVTISAGNLNNDYIVLGIEHECTDKTMYLEVKKA